MIVKIKKIWVEPNFPEGDTSNQEELSLPSWTNLGPQEDPRHDVHAFMIVFVEYVTYGALMQIVDQDMKQRNEREGQRY